MWMIVPFAATSLYLFEALKTGFQQHIKFTDLGELHWLLGIEVKQDREACTIHLSQRSYIDSILRRFNFEGLKPEPLSIPMDTQVRLITEQVPASAAEFTVIRDVPCREAVGALNWAALAIHPDIAFAVATMARFTAGRVRGLSCTEDNAITLNILQLQASYYRI